MLYRALRTYIYWALETRMVGFKWSRTLLKLFAQRKAMNHLKNQVGDPASWNQFIRFCTVLRQRAGDVGSSRYSYSFWK